MRSRRNKFLIVFILSAGLLLIFINVNAFGFYTYIISQQSIARFFKGSKTQKTFRHECVLSQLNPWDPQVTFFLDSERNPSKGCSSSQVMHTELENGTLRMLDDTNSKCEYRCLYTNGELSFKGGEWVSMTKNTSYYESCDFIETHCMKNVKTTFRYIHVQKEDELHPGVFMIILGSTSLSSGIRTIVETNQVLRQFYDATTFYYHNKVGISSRPNAFAIFSGTRVTKLDEYRSPGKSEPELPNSCKDGVVKNETITYDFVDQNYASIIAEDMVGVFNPNCKGYGIPPTDHYGAPLILRSTQYISHAHKKEFNAHFYKGECHERYHKLMDFVGKFLDEYNGISKFVVTWLSMLSHNSASGLYRTDTYFANFFRKHINNLNNSFIFVLGDHGLRFGDIRNTAPGIVEENNPLLMLAVPKYLRTNEQLILNLKINSRRHTSQYDIYATLYDIARFARKDNFQKWDEHDFRKEFGEIRGSIRARSLLRPIRYDRTCEDMEIPSLFCICSQKWRPLRWKNETFRKAAYALIAHINDFLKMKGLDGICATLSLTQAVYGVHLIEQPVMRVTVRASPGKGIYEAELLEEKNGYKVISNVIRMNSYGNQGNCVMDEDVRPLCYCRQQLTTTSKNS